MDLVLIRHPAPAVASGVCYGASDLPLAGDAADEARAIVARLRARGFRWPAQVLTSPLVRCASVAQAIGERLPADVRIEPRLREIDFGAWEMQRWDAIGREALDRWQSDLMGAREHGGESAAQFVARVLPFAEALDAQAGEAAPNVACLTHAGVMRALAAHWLGVSLDTLLARRIAYGGCLWLVRESGGWRLRAWDESLD